MQRYLYLATDFSVFISEKYFQTFLPLFPVFPVSINVMS